MNLTSTTGVFWIYKQPPPRLVDAFVPPTAEMEAVPCRPWTCHDDGRWGSIIADASVARHPRSDELREFSPLYRSAADILAPFDSPSRAAPRRSPGTHPSPLAHPGYPSLPSYPSPSIHPSTLTHPGPSSHPSPAPSHENTTTAASHLPSIHTWCAAPASARVAVLRHAPKSALSWASPLPDGLSLHARGRWVFLSSDGTYEAHLPHNLISLITLVSCAL